MRAARHWMRRPLDSRSPAEVCRVLNAMTRGKVETVTSGREPVNRGMHLIA